MLLSTKMITGFNTDVPYEGRVYHVQTEDRGQENPVLESLVYIGGTIIAKKSTPYGDQLSQGASEVTIASLLKRQHQVIIAAIKAGRIDDLIKYSSREQPPEKSPVETVAPVAKPAVPVADSKPPASTPPVSTPSVPIPSVKPAVPPVTVPPVTVPPVTVPPVAPRAEVHNLSLNSASPKVDAGQEGRPAGPPRGARKQNSGPLSSKRASSPLSSPSRASGPLKRDSGSLGKSAPLPKSPPRGRSGGLDLDEVISDYLKRTAEQGKLDLKVLTPNIFTAGKTIALKVEVSFGTNLEPDAIVTIKIIGTAFKPQVFIGRAGRDGIASFNIALPAFTAGTAAIVIEAQSKRGRGELKHLIRRS